MRTTALGNLLLHPAECQSLSCLKVEVQTQSFFFKRSRRAHWSRGVCSIESFKYSHTLHRVNMPTLLATTIQGHSTLHAFKKAHNDAKKGVSPCWGVPPSTDCSPGLWGLTRPRLFLPEGTSWSLRLWGVGPVRPLLG